MGNEQLERFTDREVELLLILVKGAFFMNKFHFGVKRHKALCLLPQGPSAVSRRHRPSQSEQLEYLENFLT